MNLKKKSIYNCLLYWVAGPGDTELPLLEVLEESVRGGLDVFQLRDKSLSDEELLPLAVKISQFLQNTSCLFIVNDRPDLAAQVEADGVHIGQDDCSIQDARAVLLPDQLVGLSTHSFEQASKSKLLGADYIGYGPIFKTPTKPDYVPVGPSAIQKVLDEVDVPVFCIGGVGEHNLDALIDAGANRIAVVREIAHSMNPYKATKEIKKKLEVKHEFIKPS